MRFRTYEEATAFIKALMKAKKEGSREFMGVKLDSVPAWTGQPKDENAPEWVPDGSRIEAVYLSYRKPTDKQKDEAKQAKLGGVELQRITGRLVDVRECKDGSTQVLFVSGLRNAGDKPAFRGPNVDKGVLAYIAIDEGLGEPVDDIIARVPQEVRDQLKDMKAGKVKAEPREMDLVAVAKRNASLSKAELPEDNGPEENRMKLK